MRESLRSTLFLLALQFIGKASGLVVTGREGRSNHRAFGGTRSLSYLPFDERKNQYRSGSSSSSTRLSAWRKYPAIILTKLSSELVTSTLAMPMFMASALPWWRGTGDGATETAGDWLSTIVSAAAAQSSGSSTVSESQHISASAVDAVVPRMEAAVFNDFAHVTLDLTTLFGPATLPVRLATLAGRLCAMASDYIPDHVIQPDDLAFHLLMLGIGWVGLVRAALPVALAAFASDLTLRDGKAFSLAFQPAGMTWRQFKTLLAFSAIDWIHLEEGRIITSEEQLRQPADSAEQYDYIYWLYSGDVTIQSKGKVLHNVTRCLSAPKQRDQQGIFLLGEARLLRRLVNDENDSQLSRGGAATGRDEDSIEVNAINSNSKGPKKNTQTTAKSGPAGATLLRMNTDKLSVLMEYDHELAKCMRNLVFQGMQDKLTAHLDG